MDERTGASIAYQAVHFELDKALDKLTQPQRELFAKVYPHVTEANVNVAFDLVQRTLRKNEREGRS